jgi:hypothetical protein
MHGFEDWEGRRVGVPKIGDGNMPSLPALYRVIHILSRMLGKPMAATVPPKCFKAGNSEQFSLRDAVCAMNELVFSSAL